MAGETATLNTAIDTAVAKCQTARASLGHGSINTANNEVLDDVLTSLATLLAALKVWTTATGA